jgi:predicted membrane protein
MELVRRIGPYLLVEILLPGGTLLAVLLYLYRRKIFSGAVDPAPGHSTIGVTP